MTDSRKAFLDEIEAFLARTGMQATELGAEALNDTAFVKRLREGRDVTMRRADKVRAFMVREERKRERRVA